MWKNCVIGGAISAESACNILAGISSGPEAFLGFIARSNFSIPCYSTANGGISTEKNLQCELGGNYSLSVLFLVSCLHYNNTLVHFYVSSFIIDPFCLISISNTLRRLDTLSL